MKLFLAVVIPLFFVQTSASFFDDVSEVFQPIEYSVGRIVTDVVSDLRETIDCTILSVENVFSLGGMFGDNSEYERKCKGGTTTEYQTPTVQYTDYNQVTVPPIKNTVKKVVIITDETKKALTDHIHESVKNTSLKIESIVEKSDAKERIENVKSVIKNETDRLGEVGKLLRSEIDKLSEESKHKFKLLNFDAKVSVKQVLREIGGLYKVEQTEKTSSKANEIRHVFDNVLETLRGTKPGEYYSDDEEVKEILKHLRNPENDSLINIEEQFNEWKKSESQTDGNQDITNNKNVSKLQKEIDNFPKTFQDIAKKIFDDGNSASAKSTRNSEIIKSLDSIGKSRNLDLTSSVHNSVNQIMARSKPIDPEQLMNSSRVASNIFNQSSRNADSEGTNSLPEMINKIINNSNSAAPDLKPVNAFRQSLFQTTQNTVISNSFQTTVNNVFRELHVAAPQPFPTENVKPSFSGNKQFIEVPSNFQARVNTVFHDSQSIVPVDPISSQGLENIGLSDQTSDEQEKVGGEKSSFKNTINNILATPLVVPEMSSAAQVLSDIGLSDKSSINQNQFKEVTSNLESPVNEMIHTSKLLRSQSSLPAQELKNLGISSVSSLDHDQVGEVTSNLKSTVNNIFDTSSAPQLSSESQKLDNFGKLGQFDDQHKEKSNNFENTMNKILDAHNLPQLHSFLPTHEIENFGPDKNNIRDIKANFENNVNKILNTSNLAVPQSSLTEQENNNLDLSGQSSADQETLSEVPNKFENTKDLILDTSKLPVPQTFLPGQNIENIDRNQSLLDEEKISEVTNNFQNTVNNILDLEAQPSLRPQKLDNLSPPSQSLINQEKVSSFGNINDESIKTSDLVDSEKQSFPSYKDNMQNSNLQGQISDASESFHGDADETLRNFGISSVHSIDQDQVGEVTSNLKNTVNNILDTSSAPQISESQKFDNFGKLDQLDDQHKETSNFESTTNKILDANLPQLHSFLPTHEIENFGPDKSSPDQNNFSDIKTNFENNVNKILNTSNLAVPQSSLTEKQPNNMDLSGQSSAGQEKLSKVLDNFENTENQLLDTLKLPIPQPFLSAQNIENTDMADQSLLKEEKISEVTNNFQNTVNNMLDTSSVLEHQPSLRPQKLENFSLPSQSSINQEKVSSFGNINNELIKTSDLVDSEEQSFSSDKDNRQRSNLQGQISDVSDSFHGDADRTLRNFGISSVHSIDQDQVGKVTSNLKSTVNNILDTSYLSAPQLFSESQKFDNFGKLDQLDDQNKEISNFESTTNKILDANNLPQLHSIPTQEIENFGPDESSPDQNNFSDIKANFENNVNKIVNTSNLAVPQSSLTEKQPSNLDLSGQSSAGQEKLSEVLNNFENTKNQLLDTLKLLTLQPFLPAQNIENTDMADQSLLEEDKIISSEEQSFPSDEDNVQRSNIQGQISDVSDSFHGNTDKTLQDTNLIPPEQTSTEPENSDLDVKLTAKNVADEVSQSTTPLPGDEDDIQPLSPEHEALLSDFLDSVPEEDKELFKSFFDLSDKAEGAVKEAQSIVDQSQKSSKILNNLFDNINPESAVNVFDNPDLLNSG